jgi:plasmid stability protein
MARTLTLDEDVMTKLEHEAQRTGTAPEALANEVLRRGLETAVQSGRRFVVRARDLGARPDVNFDCAWKLLDDLDGSTSK